MRPVAKWTLRQRRWSVFWWCLGIGAMVVLTMAFYPTFRDQANLDQSLQRIPDAAKSFIADTNDFFSPAGYLSSQIFYLTLPMLLGILAVGLGSSLLAREEESGTIEHLLARPLARGKLLAGKTVAGTGVLTIVSVFCLVCLLISAKAVHIPVPLPAIAATMLSAAVLALLFGSIAFTITAISRVTRVASIGIAALVGIGGYIITSLSSAAEWLRWPAKALPFYYYHPGEILMGKYHWNELVGFTAAIMVLGLIAWWTFRYRDLGA